MADISIITRLLNGVQRTVDISQNSLVVGSLKVGSSSPTELTKAILDKLILIHGQADADGTFDTRYTQIADLASNANGEGASLVGIEDAAANFTATDVEGALAELYAGLGSGAAADVTYDNATSGLTATDVQAAIDEVEGRVDATETVANAAIPASQKGAANGVATLDANTLIPITQIPPAALERLVIVADEAARFALTLSTVQNGDTVKQTDTNVMYFVKDDAELDNAAGYEVYSAGTASSVAWSGVTGTPTTVAGYGITDVDDVAKAAAVADSITDGITDVAPSQNAVFDALAGKQAASANLDEADTFFGSTDLSASEAEQLSDGSNADSLHSHASLKALSELAGESFAAATLFAVRYAQNAETAGRMYKADNDATSTDNFYAMGLVLTVGALSAGNAMPAVTKSGLMTVTAHGFTVGKPIYLGASGAITSTAPSAANSAVVKIGMVKDANTLDIQIQTMGIN
jgi:hypothetical protein